MCKIINIFLYYNHYPPRLTTTSSSPMKSLNIARSRLFSLVRLFRAIVPGWLGHPPLLYPRSVCLIGRWSYRLTLPLKALCSILDHAPYNRIPFHVQRRTDSGVFLTAHRDEIRVPQHGVFLLFSSCKDVTK